MPEDTFSYGAAHIWVTQCRKFCNDGKNMLIFFSYHDINVEPLTNDWSQTANKPAIYLWSNSPIFHCILHSKQKLGSMFDFSRCTQVTGFKNMYFFLAKKPQGTRIVMFCLISVSCLNKQTNNPPPHPTLKKNKKKKKKKTTTKKKQTKKTKTKNN